jgi:hypothetical protein
MFLNHGFTLKRDHAEDFVLNVTLKQYMVRNSRLAQNKPTRPTHEIPWF